MNKIEQKDVVVKKKFNFKKFLIVLLVLYLFGFLIYKIVVSPVRNIFIENNKYLTDQEVIDSSSLRNYPSFLLTSKYTIKKKLLKNELIKNVKITKKPFGVITINVEENTPLFYYDKRGKTVLEDGKLINKNNFQMPVLINTVSDDMFNKLVEKYDVIDENIRLMISEIEYYPNDIDKERFILTMNDGNYVYITLYKTYLVNDYIKILSTLENKKGILYLDSGNYFEIFK